MIYIATALLPFTKSVTAWNQYIIILTSKRRFSSVTMNCVTSWICGLFLGSSWATSQKQLRGFCSRGRTAPGVKLYGSTTSLTRQLNTSCGPLRHKLTAETIKTIVQLTVGFNPALYFDVKWQERENLCKHIFFFYQKAETHSAVCY